MPQFPKRTPRDILRDLSTITHGKMPDGSPAPTGPPPAAKPKRAPGGTPAIDRPTIYTSTSGRPDVNLPDERKASRTPALPRSPSRGR